MAEKVRIAELSIETKELLKSLTETKQEIDSLSDSQKKLKKEGESSSEQFVKQEARLKGLRSEYGRQIKVLDAVTQSGQKLNKELTREIKSVSDAAANNKELRKIRNEVNATTEEGAKQIKEINKRIDENTEFIKDNVSQLEKQKANVGNYTKAIKAARLGAVAFGAALKAAGIGLIVSAVAGLTSAFQRNQKVADTFATVFNAIGIVFDKTVGAIIEAVEAQGELNGSFDATVKVLKGSLGVALNSFLATFQALKGSLIAVNLAWEQSPFGDGDVEEIARLNAELEETNEKFQDFAVKAGANALLAVNNFGEAVEEVADTIDATADNVANTDFSDVIDDAEAITRYQSQLERLEAQQEGIIQQKEAEAERLRQVRDNITLSFEERQAASDALLEKLDEQQRAEEALIQTKIRGQELILKQNDTNVAAQAELIRLTNELSEVENRIESQRSEQQAARLGLRQEEIDAIRSFEDQKREILNEAALLRQEDEQERAELELEQRIEAERLEFERQLEDKILTAEQFRELDKALEQQRLEELQELRDGAAEERDKKKGDAEQAIFDQEQKLAEQRLALAEKISSTLLSLFGETVAGRIAAAVIEGTIAIAQIKVQTAQSAAQIIGATQVAVAKAVAASPLTFGQPFAGVAIANGAKALALNKVAAGVGIAGVVASQISKNVKFEQGGVLSGDSHAHGGIKTPYGELEGGEAVINKRSTAAFRPLLSAINAAGGGKKFAEGGILGAAETATSPQIIDYNALANAFASMPNPVVSVEEISERAGEVQAIENLASF